jgi:hypothetical protein
MMNFDRFGAPQSILIIAVISLVLFFGGFWIARTTAASAARTEPERSRYQFLQVGDTVAAIDVATGEAYAIDGNTRAWTLLAPPLPSRNSQPAR